MPRKRRRPPRPAGRPQREALYSTLDLHGDSAAAACLRAERWLREQQAAGERTVRLITGRGVHSVGPPVLPLEIDHLLHGLRGTLVADHGAEPGGGAFLVELRRPPRPAPRPPLPTLPPDPALRRAAEESLAELGIAPTPELLAVEMERLKRQL